MVNIATLKKIVYPVFSAVLIGLMIWQYYSPETHWLGKDKEFWYSTVYLALVLGVGIPVLVKWRRSRYFTVRTISCMVTQLFFGYLFIYFLLPYSWRGAVIAMNQYPFTAFAQNFWPLEIYGLLIPVYFGFSAVVVAWLLYTVITSLILMPILVLRFGRAYCSWFCACGNLAETFGDSFRTQSPKGRSAVTAEWIIVPFVLFAIAATVGIGFGLGNRDAWQTIWGYWVKFVFAGALGLGLYPVLGNRIWCRYWCPWAGLFGALSKAGVSRIEANNMCMGCGLCNKHCEMGIDIRVNALHGRPTKTTSCVYCGACVAVCPRKVLKLK